MKYCALCGSARHKWDSDAHTDKEKEAYARMICETIRSNYNTKISNAYYLVAKDIKKNPKNIVKLAKRLGSK
jgi:hypothetical protein